MNKITTQVRVGESQAASRESSTSSTPTKAVNNYQHERYVASSEEDQLHTSRNNQIDALRAFAMANRRF